MTADIDKRTSSALRVLLLGIACMVGSNLVPYMEYTGNWMLAAHGQPGVVYGWERWAPVGSFISSLRWPLSKAQIIQLAKVLFAGFYIVLYSSAPWLVGFYSRATALRWLARGVFLLFLIGHGENVFLIHNLSGITLKVGYWLEVSASYLFVTGFFLIPKKSANEPILSDALNPSGGVIFQTASQKDFSTMNSDKNDGGY